MPSARPHALASLSRPPTLQPCEGPRSEGLPETYMAATSPPKLANFPLPFGQLSQQYQSSWPTPVPAQPCSRHDLRLGRPMWPTMPLCSGTSDPLRTLTTLLYPRGVCVNNLIPPAPAPGPKP